MKKTTAKEKTIKKVKNDLLEEVDLEEISVEDSPVAAELDPDVLKVLTKPKKSKNSVDTTDYIPELERGDVDEEFGPSPDDF